MKRFNRSRAAGHAGQTNRIPLLVRNSAFALLFALLLHAPASRGDDQKTPTLMTMVMQWRYPEAKIGGATMTDAATVNAAGARTVPSVQYKVVLTTKDPMSKVIAFYERKLKPAEEPKADGGDKPVDGHGQSVTVHDDSQGRPVAVHIIYVNTEKASTTLVISRAESESETHIAFAHYQRF